MKRPLENVRPGLILAGIILLFGVCMGVVFGVMEDGVKQFIVDAIAAHPELHDAQSPAKIWRWWLRAHFHAVGIAAFTLALISITEFSGLSARMKKITSILHGLGGLYAVSWFAMALLAPSLGRDAAHHALPVLLLVLVGVGSLLIGIAILFSNIIFGWFSDHRADVL